MALLFFHVIVRVCILKNNNSVISASIVTFCLSFPLKILNGDKFYSIFYMLQSIAERKIF